MDGRYLQLATKPGDCGSASWDRTCAVLELESSLERNEHREIVKLLVERGADINRAAKSDICSPIQIAYRTANTGKEMIEDCCKMGRTCMRKRERTASTFRQRLRIACQKLSALCCEEELPRT